MSLRHAYISVNKFNIIYFSQTYLESSVSSDDVNLEVPGYNLVCPDNITNTKRGGFCISCRDILRLKVIYIQFLNACINFEIRIGRKMHNFL